MGTYKPLPLKIVAANIQLISASETLISLCHQIDVSKKYYPDEDDEITLALQGTSNIIREIINNLISTTPLAIDDIFFILKRM